MHWNFKFFYVFIVLIIGLLIYFYVVPYVKHLLLHSDTKKLYANLDESQVPWQVYAKSEKGNNIYLVEIGNNDPTTIIFGAFHGDEQNGFHLAVHLADSLYTNPNIIDSRVVIVPAVNPDGLLKRTRTNSNGVDINRNFPTENWTPVYKKNKNHPGFSAGSEKETQIVIEIMNQYNPAKIISIHSPLGMNNFDGPAEDLVKAMARYNGYPVNKEIGYPTPGSFGTFAGLEMRIPTVTLELPDIGPDLAWKQNALALIRAINF